LKRIAFLIASAVALASLTVLVLGHFSSGGVQPVHAAGDTFALDCDATTVAIDATCNVPVGGTFYVGFSSTSLSSDEVGWQSVFNYTDSVVSYTSVSGLFSTAPSATKSGNLATNAGIACAPDAANQSPPIPENASAAAGTGRIFMGCAGANVSVPQPLASYVFACGPTAGVATFHLMSPTEDVGQGGSGVVDPNDFSIRYTSGTDTTVNCITPPTATATTVPPTSTPVPPTATPTPKPASPFIVKDPANQNVFLCDPANALTCITNGGTLNTALINEEVDNVSAPLGAYEFQVKFDNSIWSNVLVSDGSGCPLNCGDPASSLIGSAFNRIPDCTASVVTENYIDFGCTSTGDPSDGFTCGACPATLAQITLFAREADLAQRMRPGNNNGVVTPVLDEHCELADTLGHPEPGANNLQPGQSSEPGSIQFGANGATGGLVSCTNAFVTVRFLEGDLNKDCTVNAQDAQLIASHYATNFGVTGYDRWLDLEPSYGDFDIDIKDLQKVFGREGSNCGGPIPPQPPVAPVDP
jgi:hypothetical protein